jgi:hypothetical protein
LPYYFSFVNTNNKKSVRYDISDKNGIVINPNQLIYSVEHGTPLAHGTADSGIKPNINRL